MRTLITVELWDGTGWPGYYSHGLPTFLFRLAPPGLATRRQLRAEGLCPGGHEHWAQLEWHAGRRWARLYRLDLARPKRVPSSSQLAALEKASTARRTCRECSRTFPHDLPTSVGRQCWNCWTTNTNTEQKEAA